MKRKRRKEKEDWYFKGKQCFESESAWIRIRRLYFFLKDINVFSRIFSEIRHVR
jgi:hypothetical protein